jgi:hypothetical protein
MPNDCNLNFKQRMKRRDEQYARMSDSERALHDREQKRQRTELADRLCFLAGERSKNDEYESGL